MLGQELTSLAGTDVKATEIRDRLSQPLFLREHPHSELGAFFVWLIRVQYLVASLGGLLPTLFTCLSTLRTPAIYGPGNGYSAFFLWLVHILFGPGVAEVPSASTRPFDQC
jgi:hypothetical protein